MADLYVAAYGRFEAWRLGFNERRCARDEAAVVTAALPAEPAPPRSPTVFPASVTAR